MFVVACYLRKQNGINAVKSWRVQCVSHRGACPNIVAGALCKPGAAAMLNFWLLSSHERTEPTGRVDLADGHEHRAPFGTLAVISAAAFTMVVVIIIIASYASSEGSGRIRRLSGESASSLGRSARFGLVPSFDEAIAACVRCIASLTLWLRSRRARKRIERQHGVRTHRLKWAVFVLLMVYTYCNTDNYPFGEVLQQMGWLTEVADKRIYTGCSPSMCDYAFPLWCGRFPCALPRCRRGRSCCNLCSSGADVAEWPIPVSHRMRCCYAQCRRWRRGRSGARMRRCRQDEAFRHSHAVLS